MSSPLSAQSLSIPPLISGGVILTYHCTNACRHCLYRCSPQQPNEWMTLEMAKKVFSTLSKEKSLDSVHLAGGEPCLQMDLLAEVVRIAVRADVRLAYLETNAAWCVDPGRTRKAFELLRDAGLPAVLVSASMFHNEFIPFRRTRLCVETAREVFGRDAVIIWVPELYELISRLPDDQAHHLDEFCSWAGLSSRMEVLPRLYHLTPGGRVVEALRACYEARPAECFREWTCGDDLLNTTHFHIDLHGDLFTGMCPGIAAGTVENLHPAITLKSFPVTWTLARKGPYGLMQIARESCGYTPKGEGYISPCDLCYDVRRRLYATGEFPELRPDGYYREGTAKAVS